MKSLALFAALFASCCNDSNDHDRPLYQRPGRARCGKCRAVVYEGPYNVYRGGFEWPATPHDFGHRADDPRCDRIWYEKVRSGKLLWSKSIHPGAFERIEAAIAANPQYGKPQPRDDDDE